MDSLLGLKNRLCPNCRARTPHRTIYARATAEGKRKWLQLFWACTKCQSLNHVVVQAYSLTRPPSAHPSLSSGMLIRALESGPLDRNQLLADLRRNKNQGTSHVFQSEVAVALEDLRASGVVADAPRDVTAKALELLRGRRFGSCPRDAQRTLVPLYVRKRSAYAGPRFVLAGAYCLGCGYRRLTW